MQGFFMFIHSLVVHIIMNQRQYNTSVQDILRHLENIFKNQANAPQVGPYCLESLIINTDSVIFKQGSDWRGPQHSHFLTPLEELELIDELCLYLQEQKHEYVRYRIFETLFSMVRENALEYRKEILCRLVSLGVVSKSAAVLECAALWMKLLMFIKVKAIPCADMLQRCLYAAPSCKREHAIYLMMSLVTDYCTLQIDETSALKSCAEISPRFCCLCMIALTSKYKMILTENHSENWPCPELLDVVQCWLTSDPALFFCTATQMDKLWRTVIKATHSMPDSLSLTPLDGLAQWCVKSPFAPMVYQKSFSKQTANDDPNSRVTYAGLHSRLHYAFLKSLLASKPALKAIAKGSVLGNPDLQLWNKNQVHSLIGDLMSMCSRTDATPSPGSSDQTAVDRFAQIAQVCMSMRILNCSKNQFQSLSDPLPKTRLLEVVAYGVKRRRSHDDTAMDTDY